MDEKEAISSNIQDTIGRYHKQEYERRFDKNNWDLILMEFLVMKVSSLVEHIKPGSECRSQLIFI
jgi:hypothetical protein